MSATLIALWFALIGADRIDLAGGHGPFVLTPFLLLTPLVIIVEAFRRHRTARQISLSRRTLAYAAVSTALLCVVLASVFVAKEIPVSAARITLLLLDVMGTFAVVLSCADRPELGRILARGAVCCLPLFIVFNVVESFYWIGQAPETLPVAGLLIHFGPLQSAGPLPRLAGPVADANRTAFVLLCFITVIARWERTTWLRRAGIAVGIVLLALTFSRSGTLATVTAATVALISRRRTPTLQAAVWVALTAVTIATVFLLRPDVAAIAVAAVESPLSERLSSNEGSAQSHVALVKRGAEEATRSVPRMFTGLGYGTSYLFLQDFFPGNRYGNYHSLYVTMFAEAGVFALLLTLILMFAPLTWGGPWRVLVAGAIPFNMFYQTTTEPVFWFVLAAAWAGLLAPRLNPSGRRIGDRPPSPVAA
jgi:hypothetical protein